MSDYLTGEGSGTEALFSLSSFLLVKVSAESSYGCLCLTSTSETTSLVIAESTFFLNTFLYFTPPDLCPFLDFWYGGCPLVTSPAIIFLFLSSREISKVKFP